MTIENTERPLVTFALFAYNQERFIREAVEAALAQTYSPLEVILSDDCSSDRTFEIMTECVKEYAGGHTVVLNRNTENLGIGAHVDLLSNKATGLLIVVAAGDDVSLSCRVEKIVDHWVANGCKGDSICSDAIVIDGDGNTLGIQIGKPFAGNLLDGVRTHFSGIQGATHAWTKRSHDIFGAMLPGTVCEDRVIPLRSHLLGGVDYVNEPLVRYRVHGANVSHFSTVQPEAVIRKTAEIHRRNANISWNHVKDIDLALSLGVGDKKELRNAKKAAIRIQRISERKADFLVASNMMKLWLLIKTVSLSPTQSLRFALMIIVPSLYEKQQLRNLGIS